MVSKKEAVMLAALMVGGIGLATAVHGGGDAAADGDGVLGQPMTMPVRAVGILGAQEGYGYTPKIDQAPPQQAVIFPDPPNYREVIDKFFAKPEIPESRGAAGVSAAPKKKVTYTDTGRVAVGYEGYKMPLIPTPYAPKSGTFWSDFAIAESIPMNGSPKPKKYNLTPAEIERTSTYYAPGGGGTGSSSGKGDSGTATPGRPYISKKPV